MKKYYLLIIGFLLPLFVNYSVLTSKDSPLLSFLWLASIILLVLFAIDKKKFKFSKKTIIIAVSLGLFACLIRVAFIDVNHSFYDEHLAAYFATHSDYSGIKFFGPIPQNSGM